MTAWNPGLGRITRTLVLAADHTGFVEGHDVALLQRNLRKKVAPTLTIDGEYGPATASAVAVWKRYYAGYPDKYLKAGIANAIGVDGQRILNGQKKLPDDYLVRAAFRRAVLKRQQAAAAAQASLGDKAYQAAKAHVGEKEIPAGSNKQPVLQREARDLKVLPWIAAMGYPWCSFFYFLMYLTVGAKAAAAGLRAYQFNVLYTPTILDLALAGRFGMRIVGWNEIDRGDGVLMNFPGGDPRVDHIGMAANPPAGDNLATIDGNTSSGTAGSQSDGGMVAERIRSRSQVRAAFRMTNTY